MPEGRSILLSYKDNMLLKNHHPSGDTNKQWSNRETSEIAAGHP